MRRALPLLGAALLLVLSLVALAVAFGSKQNANETLRRAHRLYEARLAVTRAQEDLGKSDLRSAIRSAGEANATADKVKAITTRIARLLAAAEVAAEGTATTSREAVGNVALTRRQTKATSDLLAVVAGYQRAASGFAGDTNGALVRVLRALRKTNRSFPGGGD